jgi:hypothetical protein
MHNIFALYSIGIQNGKRIISKKKTSFLLFHLLLPSTSMLANFTSHTEKKDREKENESSMAVSAGYTMLPKLPISERNFKKYPKNSQHTHSVTFYSYEYIPKFSS